MDVNIELLAKDIREFYGKFDTQEKMARNLGISSPHLSRILGSKVSSLRKSTLSKIVSKIGSNPDNYIAKQVVPYQGTGGFEGVTAYDLATKITYIGVLNGDDLNEACLVPTADLAKRSAKSRTSQLEVLRRNYQTMRENGSLSSFKFSPLEVIAIYNLGNDGI
jgi:transcriptional regulator with XRE-family HTH domain